MTAKSPPRPLTAAGALSIAAGIALFAWLIYRVGPGTIGSGLRLIGWGLAAIVVIGGLRFAVRAAAWALCVEAPHRLALRDAFAAVVAGDALGNATPLGPIVGEPAKAAFVRGRLPLAAALTALAIENVLYTLSAAAMIAGGMIALLFTFELPDRLREVSEIALATVLAIFALALWMLWRRPAIVSGSLGVLTTRVPAAAARVDRVRALEREMYTFASRRRGAMLPLVGAELLFHALGVAEVHLTLWLLQGEPPPLLTSFILETVNRLITVIFKFIPMQVGVNEAGTALVTEVLGLGAATGVTLGVVRKVRMLFWSSAGIVLLVRRGLTTRRILEDSELMPVRET
ncbi:MAG TPA: lysylphosphatidylglycerol synthase domain-containing protein [Vicinamibacterales bacterium]|nr:lysylphosphatidylglycerol synthase domain-containing protein [Vicinamibacterales bacterium]